MIKMTVEEAILDSLADDMEPITSIQSYLLFLGHEVEPLVLRTLLVKMINDGLVLIADPEDITSVDYETLKDSELEYCFFEMTELGRKRWQLIGEPLQDTRTQV